MTTTVRFGDVTVGSPAVVDADGAQWVLSRIQGWHGGVPVRGERQERPGAHGTFAERAWRDGRLTIVEGAVLCPSRAVAASAVRVLAAVLADGQFGELEVVDADEGALSARVRLGAEPTVDWVRGSTTVRYQFPLYAPDPLRYGGLISASTPFPELVGGLAYPLYTDGAGTVLGWLDYGPPSTTGTVSLTNEGTADAHPQFEVTGPAPGFEVVRVGTGDRLVFDDPIPAGSRFVVDTASGVAVMDGVSDRTLTWQDPMTVGPGETAEFAFVPRGESTAAVLRASLRPAYW